MTTSKAPPEAKAQHYIPRFYLQGFTDKQGSLWVYEKFKPIRKSAPKHEAHLPDYYTHAEQGERDETAEASLEQIESRAAPVIRKLANPEFNPSPEQMGHVYSFIAFMFARVPSWREHLDRLFGKVARETLLTRARDKKKFYKQCADMGRDTGKLLNIDYEKLREYALKGQYEIIQTSTAYNLDSMLQSALDVAGQLRDYTYEVLYAPKGAFFLTSDSPVFTLRPEANRQAAIGMGFGWSRVEVHFPLNKRARLRLKRGVAPAFVEISEDALGHMNRVTMMSASRCVYSAEGYRRVSRLFDQWGCKVEPGKNAFMPTPDPKPDLTFTHRRSRWKT